MKTGQMNGLNSQSPHTRKSFARNTLVGIGAAFLSAAMIWIAAGCGSRGDTAEAAGRAKPTIEQLTADYDLRAKCARDARDWFKENWRLDKGTLLLNYSNHYSKAQNRCYALVENHTLVSNDLWVNNLTLWDVNDNSKQGDFVLDHSFYIKPENGRGQWMVNCEISGARCSSFNEFQTLAHSYMNE